MMRQLWLRHPIHHRRPQHAALPLLIDSIGIEASPTSILLRICHAEAIATGANGGRNIATTASIGVGAGVVGRQAVSVGAVEAEGASSSS